MDKLFLRKIKTLPRTGQILIEVLVALSVVVVVVSIVTITTATSLSNVELSRNQNQATQFAQQGMEIVQSLRRSNFSAFTALSGSYCLSENSTTLTVGNSCSVNIGNTFKRAVVIQKNNIPICSGGTKATVSVTWTDGKCSSSSYCHSATVSSCIAVINVVNNL